MRGPVDYIVVGFEGNNFTGEILEELQKAMESGTIAVLDLALIARDADGSVTAIEITDPSIQALSQEPGIITDEDVEEIGELLEDGTSAGLLIIEQLWAKGLKQAIVNANGVLLDEGRIHPEAAEELSEEEDA